MADPLNLDLKSRPQFLPVNPGWICTPYPLRVACNLSIGVWGNKVTLFGLTLYGQCLPIPVSLDQKLPQRIQI